MRPSKDAIEAKEIEGDIVNELCKENIEKIIILEHDMKSTKRQLESVEEEQKVLHELNSHLKLLAEQNKYQNTKIDEQRKAVEEIRVEIVQIKTRPLNEAKDIQTKMLIAGLCTTLTLIITYIFNKFIVL